MPVAEKYNQYFIQYRCKNCESVYKFYAVFLRLYQPGPYTAVAASGHAIKFGEWPPYNAGVPARVLSVIGPDVELFNKGRRAESHGLGIGAFAYYRRVVENQKNRLLDEIITVAQRTGANEVVPALEEAKKAVEFSRAMELVKDAVPESLKIDGHNPLTLLHSALSRRLHAESDQECLELAQAIREVLSDLADRITRALRDREELRKAVGKLMHGKKPK
jgi:hypothetical protein